MFRAVYVILDTKQLSRVQSTYINGQVSGLFLWLVRVDLDGLSFLKLLHGRDHLCGSCGSLEHKDMTIFIFKIYLAKIDKSTFINL